MEKNFEFAGQMWYLPLSARDQVDITHQIDLAFALLSHILEDIGKKWNRELNVDDADFRDRWPHSRVQIAALDEGRLHAGELHRIAQFE